MKNLNKRKNLAARVLRVGAGRICFDTARLEEVKEAITKQDIRDMFAEGIITIKDKKGRARIVKRTTKRGPGKISKKVHDKKREYVLHVRKLRRYLKELKKQNKISPEKYLETRKKIKARAFKDKNHLKEHLGGKK